MEKLLVLKLKHENDCAISLEKIKEDISNFLGSKLSKLEIKIVSEEKPYFHQCGFKDVSIYSTRIRRLLNFISKNYYHNITLHQASKIINLNKYYTEKIFLSEIGIPFKKYLNIFRLSKAAELLRTNSANSITNISLDVGFNDLSNFIRQFKKNFGCSPKNFMNCCIDPKKCKSRKKSVFFNINNYFKKVREDNFVSLKYACYIKRQ